MYKRDLYTNGGAFPLSRGGGNVPACLSGRYFIIKNFIIVGNYTYESNGNVGTWSGSSTSIEFSVSSQCQINSFTVTYE